MWIYAQLAAAVITPVVLAGALWLWIRIYRQRHPDIERARKLFHLRREWLEARFFTIAANSGKPRGLEWVDCEFEDGVAYARDRQTGQLWALVGVTIRFRAVIGGPLEGEPNVANLRAATAVFQLIGDEWTTAGKASMNLNPVQAMKYYSNQLEVVE